MSDWTYRLLPDTSVETLVKQACDDIQKLISLCALHKTAKLTNNAPATGVTTPVPYRAPTTAVPATGANFSPTGVPADPIQQQIRQIYVSLQSSRDALSQLVPVFKQKRDLALQIAGHLKQMNGIVNNLVQNMPDHPTAQRMSRWWGSTLGQIDPTRVNPEKLLVVVTQMVQNFSQFANAQGGAKTDKQQWNAGKKLFNQPQGRPGSANRPLINTLTGQPMDMFPRHNEQGQTVPPQIQKGVQQELNTLPSQKTQNPLFPNMKPKKPNFLQRMLGRGNRASVIESGRFFKSAENNDEWYWKLG